jgi:hypothetical protein
MPDIERRIKMKYYGLIGQSLCMVDETASPQAPDGYIEMQGERPSPAHIAQEGGTWALPAPTPEEVQETLTAAVQAYLDAKVKERGYDSILSACSYATSTDTTFAAEGQVCAAWRDSVWRKCYGVLAAVTAGERDIPTPDALITELPALVWPPL